MGTSLYLAVFLRFHSHSQLLQFDPFILTLTMRLSSVAFVLALAVTAQCVAVPHSHVVHEKREVLFSKWVKREKLGAYEILPLCVPQFFA
jgi:hypothetical protein